MAFSALTILYNYNHQLLAQRYWIQLSPCLPIPTTANKYQFPSSFTTCWFFPLCHSVIKLVCNGDGSRQTSTPVTGSSPQRNTVTCTPLTAEMYFLILSQHLPSFSFHWIHTMLPPVVTSYDCQGQLL